MYPGQSMRDKGRAVWSMPEARNINSGLHTSTQPREGRLIEGGHCILQLTQVDEPCNASSAAVALPPQ